MEKCVQMRFLEEKTPRRAPDSTGMLRIVYIYAKCDFLKILNVLKIRAPPPENPLYFSPLNAGLPPPENPCISVP